MRRQLGVGTQGAARVKMLLARRFGTLVDYEGNREKQRAGIDIYIKPWGFIEIKTDTHKNTNVFLEYECGGKDSGVMTSQAQWWAYYFPELQLIYMLPVEALRRYLRRNWKWFLAKYNKEVSSYAGKRRWTAHGFALPRDFLCAELAVVIYEDYDNKLWLVAGKEVK